MILVLGATGAIGRPLVQRLRERGEKVRAFVRDPERGRELGVELAVGDLDDAASVARAMEGVDRVLLNAGPAIPVDGPQPMVAQQITAIDAAVRAGVEHVVKISVWGAREDGRLAERAHWEIEQHLAASGLVASILAPSAFMQNFVTGAATFSDDGDLIAAFGEAGISYVDAADIAACAAALLIGPPGGGTYVVTGPEALSYTEIAALLSDILGRPVRYRDLPADELAGRLVAQGLPTQFADDVATLYRRVAAGSLEGVTSTVEDLTGRPPTRLADFVRAHKEQLVLATGSAVPS